MSDEKQKNQARFAKFDLIVGTVVVLLIFVIGAVTYLDNPQRQGAKVAYLYPLTSSASGETAIPNIWLASVANPDDAQQLTNSRMGIFDFAVSNNGRYIAYSERDEELLLLDLYLLDLQTGDTSRLTNCAAEDSECYTPVFHPDNNTLAYMKKSLNRDLVTVSPGVSRIWLLDIAARTTQPLTTNTQMLGHSPVWSPDGNTIAFFSSDLNNPQILIYNFNPQIEDKRTVNAVPSQHGTTGTISPNGQRLIFPDIVDRGGVIETHLKIVDLSTDPVQFVDFTDKDGQFSDLSAQWHPDGQTVTVARKYNDDRWTLGHQLYNIDADTDDVTPLLVDSRFTHSFYTWNNTGTKLLLQRLALRDEQGNPERAARPAIWVLDSETGELVKVSDFAYHPRWVLP